MKYEHLLFYLLNVLIHSSVYVFLVVAPFRSRLRLSLPKTCGVASIWVIFMGVMDVLFFEIETLIPEVSTGALVLVAIAWSSVSVIMMRLLIRSSFLQLIFVLFVLAGFQSNLMMYARALYFAHPFPALVAGFPYFNYLLFTVLTLAVALPLLWYLHIVLFQKVVATNIDFLQWKYLFILPLSYYLYCRVSRFGGVDLLHPQLGDFLLLILLNLFAYIAYVSVMKMLLKSYDTYKIGEQAAVMERQLDVQRAQYEKLTESIESTVRLRHDWRHHLLIIKGYTDSGDRAGLEQYLGNYFAENQIEDEAPVCENHSVDILLSHYIAIAKAAGAAVDVSVSIPESPPVSDYKLCIVFGNLVENAIESCVAQKTGDRFIKIKAQMVGAQLAIAVENSYDGEILKDADDFLSTKHSGCGVGVSSVRGVAEKSGGNFRVSHADGVFKVAVLLS